MDNLDHFERQIIHFLIYTGPANTNRVAEGVRISWATADQKLKHLHRMGYVTKIKDRVLRGAIWKLRFI